MVKLAGATPVIVETTDRTEFKLTPAQLRAAITPRTRLLILNSPSNPTGSVYTPEEMKAIGDVCVEKGVLIMSDEIYEHLLYDGAVHRSMASFSPAHYEHTVVVHGFAKAWSMTGWRLGFLAAPEPIAKAIDAVQSHSTSNPTSFAQKGAVAALNGPQDHLPKWLAEYDRRRSFAWKRLNEHARRLLRQREGRVLPLPEHLGHRAQVVRVLRPPARVGEGRRCSGRRLRRRRLHAAQLRHQHGQPGKGPGAHRPLRAGTPLDLEIYSRNA